MSIQFRSRIKSTIDYSKVLNGIGVCCDKDGNKSLKAFYDCFDDGGNYFPGENLDAVNCPGVVTERGCCCACSFVDDTSLLPYPWDFTTISPASGGLYLDSGVVCNVSRCECERIRGKFTPSAETSVILTSTNISSLCYKPAPEFGTGLMIDARYPRACCRISRDPVTGFPTDVICDNVCLSSECAALGSLSNPAIYGVTAACNQSLYKLNGVNGGVANCNTSKSLAQMMNKSTAYKNSPFGSCYTLELSSDTKTYEYTCNITPESLCATGYWVESQYPMNPFCNDTYTPMNPTKIQNTYDSQRMTQEDFDSLKLEIGMEYQGGIYIGIYEPGSPVNPKGSALYGNIDFDLASTHYPQNIGVGGTDKKWAVIVDMTHNVNIPFAEEDENDIYYNTSLWDGYYNTYGNNLTFSGIKTKLTNTIKYKPRNGFIDYYIPSLYELYFYANYLTTHEETFSDEMNGYYYSSTMFNSNYINNNSNKVQINNSGMIYAQSLKKKYKYSTYALTYNTLLIPKNTKAKFSFFRRIVIE